MSERKEAAFLIKAGIEGLEGKRKKRRQLKMIVKCYVKLLKIYKLACMHVVSSKFMRYQQDLTRHGKEHRAWRADIQDIKD